MHMVSTPIELIKIQSILSLLHCLTSYIPLHFILNFYWQIVFINLQITTEWSDAINPHRILLFILCFFFQSVRSQHLFDQGTNSSNRFNIPRKAILNKDIIIKCKPYETIFNMYTIFKIRQPSENWRRICSRVNIASNEWVPGVMPVPPLWYTPIRATFIFSTTPMMKNTWNIIKIITTDVPFRGMPSRLVGLFLKL